MKLYANKARAKHLWKIIKRLRRKQKPYEHIREKLVRKYGKTRWLKSESFQKFILLVDKEARILRKYFIAKGWSEPPRFPRLPIKRFPR